MDLKGTVNVILCRPSIIKLVPANLYPSNKIILKSDQFYQFPFWSLQDRKLAEILKNSIFCFKTRISRQYISDNDLNRIVKQIGFNQYG